MLRFLIEKEFKQIIRHPFIPKLIFIFPCMVMLVFPWAATFEIRDVNLGVVDSDHSPYSQRLVQKIVSSGYFRLTDVSDTYPQALQGIENHSSDLVLTIGQGFGRDLLREGSTKVMIAANSVNGTKSGLGTSYLAAIIRDFAGELRLEQGAVQVANAIPIIDIATQYRFNPHLD